MTGELVHEPFWAAATETICELCKQLLEVGDLVRWNANQTRVICASHGPQSL